MIIIALMLFGVFVAYTYIGFQTSKFHYASDFTYVLFKFRILLGTVALGYFATMLSNFYISFPLIGTYLDAFTSVVSVGFVRNLLAMISTIWITFALAMLPFNHTVFNVEDDSINEERTKSLTELHHMVYGIPFYVMFVVFSLNLFFFLIALCVRDEEVKSWADSEGDEGGWMRFPPLKKLAENWKKVRPTLGFHFYVTADNADEADSITSNVNWFKWQ